MPVFLLIENEIGFVTEIVAFDVTESENHEQVAEYTSNPIEEGANTTDHVLVNPPTISCEVFVTNQPSRSSVFFPERGGEYLPEIFRAPAAYASHARPPIFTPGAGTRALVGLADQRFSPQIFKATVLKFLAFDSVAATEEKLDAIINERKPIRLVTTLKEYPSVLLIRKSTPITVGRAGGASFVLDFAGINKVTAEIVKAPVDPVELRGEPKDNRGGKGATQVNMTKEADDSKREAMRSAAKQLLGDIGKF